MLGDGCYVRDRLTSNQNCTDNLFLSDEELFAADGTVIMGEHKGHTATSFLTDALGFLRADGRFIGAKRWKRLLRAGGLTSCVRTGCADGTMTAQQVKAHMTGCISMVT